MKIEKRGKTYRAVGIVSRRRIKVSLGVRDEASAIRVLRHLEYGLLEGPKSEHWMTLQTLFPAARFQRLAELIGWAPPTPKKPDPTWIDLTRHFDGYMRQRIALGKLRDSTAQRYRRTAEEFTFFLSAQNTSILKDITLQTIADFKEYRMESISKKKFARGGTSIGLEAAILHGIFGRAVKLALIDKNPVELDGRPGAEPTRGAQPFTAEDLQKLRHHAGDDMLTFLVLRHTGFRGNDAAQLTWAEVDFQRREIERITEKRRKKVTLPIQSELLFMLEAEYDNRKPLPHERVLLNPLTKSLMSRKRIYERMLALGKRAGVPNAHPHRFRDTFAVDLLCAGCGIYDVARMIGDTVETVERHYTPFVPALRERVRQIMESGKGLESGTKTAHSQSDSAQAVENMAAGPVSRILSAGLLRRDGHSSGPRIAARL
jgi:integrase